MGLSWHRALPELQSGEGHGGWLISSSNGFLNLWECNRGDGKQEPSLMCLHSQGVDESPSSMSVEADLRILFTAASKGSEEFVAVHSLDLSTLLVPRYYFTPPPGAVKTYSRMMQQVISVHGMHPAVANCCVASFGEKLVVFTANPNTPVNARLTNARCAWAAHTGSNVSALGRALLNGQRTHPLLLSGAANGTIYSWRLSEQPKDNSPAGSFCVHTGQVNGLLQLSDVSFASCGADGQVLLWDLTNPGAPTKRWVPDGTPVLAMAAHPFNDVLAVSTQCGLYILDLFDDAAPVNALLSAPPPRPYQSLTWNVNTAQLYAGAGDGSISVFRRLR